MKYDYVPDMIVIEGPKAGGHLGFKNEELGGDKEPALANAFKVRSIPTLLFIPRDKLPVISRGAMSKSELIDTINSHLL